MAPGGVKQERCDADIMAWVGKARSEFSQLKKYLELKITVS